VLLHRLGAIKLISCSVHLYLVTVTCMYCSADDFMLSVVPCIFGALLD
jgi:hypothetical protein